VGRDPSEIAEDQTRAAPGFQPRGRNGRYQIASIRFAESDSEVEGGLGIVRVKPIREAL
jgi:hypothetical protein